MDAVRELNYLPNVHARRLVSGRSGTIGFVAPVLSDPFFPECIEGVEMAARDAGLTLLLATSSHDEHRQGEVLPSLEGPHFDGVVSVPVGDVARLHPFLDRRLPIVCIDTEVDHPNAACVLSDLDRGTRLAVERLIGRGCRHLVMLDNVEEPDDRRRRRDAFIEAVPDDIERHVIEAPWTMDGGRVAAERLLAQHPAADGVFADYDVMAMGAMEVLRRAGRSIPDDIAIVGCDDIEFAAAAAPPLTTIRIDRARIGREAVARLLDLLSGAEGIEPTVVPTTLTRRETD